MSVLYYNIYMLYIYIYDMIYIYMIIQHLVSLTVQPSQSESGLLCSSAGVEAVPEVSPAGVEVRQLDADKEILAVSV